MIHLATGLAVRDGSVLLVASRYANHPQPLWNLPGGRQQPGELLEETVARELLEETGLRAEVLGLAYVSESYAGDEHFLNATFVVNIRGCGVDGRTERDHVAAVEWVPFEQIAHRIVVAVVREPLLAYLRDEAPRRYAGFHDAGITIEWPDGCE
ncbi:MAG: NUDIX domain-containing protein [Candidatus Eremiobacteraeota bacterium]|nr:NUDIX domain-containing protein [Candidatus Eremiobacteraeota bacterium]MBV9056583.1 NUDIX domain-containing protein [Candidatus Eremiobacteraeota bacterium]MBV9700639.1 NUDIX domain-containing protein [Candidatus Eremiobacteraeota bacterium]